MSTDTQEQSKPVDQKPLKKPKDPDHHAHGQGLGFPKQVGFDQILKMRKNLKGEKDKSEHKNKRVAKQMDKLNEGGKGEEVSTGKYDKIFGSKMEVRYRTKDIRNKRAVLRVRTKTRSKNPLRNQRRDNRPDTIKN